MSVRVNFVPRKALFFGVSTVTVYKTYRAATDWSSELCGHSELAGAPTEAKESLVGVNLKELQYQNSPDRLNSKNSKFWQKSAVFRPNTKNLPTNPVSPRSWESGDCFFGSRVIFWPFSKIYQNFLQQAKNHSFRSFFQFSSLFSAKTANIQLIFSAPALSRFAVTLEHWGIIKRG